MNKLPNLSVTWIQIAKHLALGIQPIHVIERQFLHGSTANAGVFSVAEVARVGKYYVPILDVFQDNPRWVFTDQETHVRVPVHAYKTKFKALASIWGMGIEVGLAASFSFVSTFKLEPKTIHIILGDECTELPDAFRCYVGIAIQL